MPVWNWRSIGLKLIVTGTKSFVVIEISVRVFLVLWCVNVCSLSLTLCFRGTNFAHNHTLRTLKKLGDLLQLWRACSTLVRSKVETRARTQEVSYPSNNFFDDDLDKSQSEEVKSPVCSYNEWDPLEEVIVGRVEGKLCQILGAILFGWPENTDPRSADPPYGPVHGPPLRTTRKNSRKRK